MTCFPGQSVAANTLGNGDRGRFFIFDCDLVVPKPHHHHHPQPHAHHHPQTHQARKANAQAANKVATAVAQTQAQASFVLTPQIKALALRSLQELKGETVYIVNKETSKPIAVAPNGGVTALGESCSCSCSCACACS